MVWDKKRHLWIMGLFANTITCTFYSHRELIIFNHGFCPTTPLLYYTDWHRSKVVTGHCWWQRAQGLTNEYLSELTVHWIVKLKSFAIWIWAGVSLTFLMVIWLVCKLIFVCGGNCRKTKHDKWSLRQCHTICRSYWCSLYQQYARVCYMTACL